MGKKADYNKKIAKIEKKILNHDHSKYITTKGYNKMKADNVAVILAPAKLATQADTAETEKRKILIIN